MVKNRIILVIYIIVLWLLNIFYYNYIIFTMLILAIALPVISVLLTRKVLDRITTTVKFNKNSIGKNIEAFIIVNVNNESFFPIVNYNVKMSIYNNFIHQEKKVYVNIPVGIRDSSEVSIKMSSTNCGKLEVHINEVSILDVFGIVMFTKKMDETTACRNNTMVIMPEIIELKNYDEECMIEGAGDIATSVKTEDISEVSGVRKYAAGDKIQKVHWKITEKLDELMVKEYALTNDNELVIMPELLEEDIDLIMNVLLSLALDMLKEDLKFCIKWYNSEFDIIEKREAESEDDVLAIISQIYENGVYDSDKAYELYIAEKVSSSSEVFYISNSKSQAQGEILVNIDGKVVLMCI